MALFKKDAQPSGPKTREERLAAATTQVAAALSFFEAAAADLSEAAIIQDQIAGEIYAEIEYLERVAAEAVNQSIDNAAAALRFRELVGQSA